MYGCAVTVETLLKIHTSLFVQSKPEESLGLSIATWSDICHIDFWEKWRRFGKGFQAKGSSVAHLPYYIVYIAR